MTERHEPDFRRPTQRDDRRENDCTADERAKNVIRQAEAARDHVNDVTGRNDQIAEFLQNARLNVMDRQGGI